MKYRFLGSSGLLVSRLALGTMTFGTDNWGCGEKGLIPAVVDHGMGLTAYSPLGGGLLTGKYKGMKEPEKGARLSFRAQTDGPRFWNEQG